MSIQFNPNALSAFSNVNFGRDAAIVKFQDVSSLLGGAKPKRGSRRHKRILTA
jgi:hypothetical protein